MIVVAAVMSVVLALALLASAVQKFRYAPAVVDQLAPLGVPRSAIPQLGMVELAAVAGLTAGLVIWPLGAAAAAGCVLYFSGAIAAHLRARDRAIAPAAVYLLFSLVLLVLLVLAHTAI